MKRILLTSIFLLSVFFISEATAQNYESSVGVRAGYYLTGTYKKFVNDSHAFEAYAGISGYYFGGIVVGALYQVHMPLEELEIDNLYWYYGGGAYAGLHTGSFDLGINLNIGLDYSFDEFPINVSLDWAPGINIVGGFYPSLVTGGLAVRYILGQ